VGHAAELPMKQSTPPGACEQTLQIRAALEDKDCLTVGLLHTKLHGCSGSNNSIRALREFLDARIGQAGCWSRHDVQSKTTDKFKTKYSVL
jgi:hypothetical protein